MRPLAGGRRMDGTDYKVKTPPSQHHEGRWELTEHLDHGGIYGVAQGGEND